MSSAAVESSVRQPAATANRQHMVARDAAVDRLSDQIVSLRLDGDTLRHDLAERDRTITGLHDAIAHEQRVAEASRAEYAAEVRQLRHELANRDQVILSLRELLAISDATIAELQARVFALTPLPVPLARESSPPCQVP